MPYTNEQEKRHFTDHLVRLKAKINDAQARYDEINRRMDHPDSLPFSYEDGQMDLVMAGDHILTVYNEKGIVLEVLPDADGISVKFEDGSKRDLPCSRISELTYESMIPVR